MANIDGNVPVDRVAHRVVQSGTRFYPQLKRAPLQVPPYTNEKAPERAKDLTGLRKGRLTVVRFHHYDRSKRDPKKRKIWLCRCDCGNYLFVTSHKLNPANRNNDMRCESCWVTQHLIDGTHEQYTK